MFGYVSSFFKGRASQETKTSGSSKATEEPEQPEYATRITLFRCRGTLYTLRGDNRYQPMCDLGAFTLQLEAVTATTGQKGAAAAAEYVLSMLDAQREAQLVLPVVHGFQLNHNIPSGAVFWGSVVDGQVMNFSFRFVSDKDYVSVLAPPSPALRVVSQEAIANAFLLVYNKVTYYQLCNMPFDATDAAGAGTADEDEEFAYYAGGRTNEVPVEDETPAAPQSQATAVGGAPLRPSRADEAVFALEATSIAGTGPAAKNTCYADSVAYNRAIVLQESGAATAGKGGITAQAHAYGAHGFTSSRPEAFSVQGVASAKEALLDSTETQMYILDDVNRQMALLDLQTGTVVSTYQPSDELGLQAICHQNKFADAGAPLVACLAHNAAYTLDLRLDPKKSVVAEGQASDLRYTLKGKGNKFTSHATSAAGHLAVADFIGDVRLYTGPPGSRKSNGTGHHAKLAKTLLKCNEPVRHLDITGDGAMVLVTTKTALLVLSTRYVDGKTGKACDGFNQRMGSSKPTPLRLQPSAAQLHAMGGLEQLDFARARFETNPQQNEAWVVAASGQHILTWSLDAIKSALARHELVACEVKDTQRHVQSVTMVGGQERVTFLSDTAIGMELRSQEVKTRKGKTTVRFS